MTSIIFGVDTSKPVTPVMARDAIVECFWAAHCGAAGFSGGDAQVTHSYCKEVVNKAFDKIGGNFQNPTKVQMLEVLDELSKFSASFRDKKTIEKHHREILKIVKKLGEANPKIAR